MSKSSLPQKCEYLEELGVLPSGKSTEECKVLHQACRARRGYPMQPFALWESSIQAQRKRPAQSETRRQGQGTAPSGELSIRAKSLGKQLGVLELQNVALGKNQLNLVTDWGGNQRKLRI